MIVTCVLLNIGLCSKHKYIDLNAEKRHLYRSFRGSNSGAGKYLRPDRNGIVRQGRNPGDFQSVRKCCQEFAFRRQNPVSKLSKQCSRLKC